MIRGTLLSTLVFALSACDAGIASPATTTPALITPAVTPTTYSDSSQRFEIEYPSTWKQNVDVVRGVRFNSVDGTSMMSVELVTSTGISDTMAYARRDSVAVAETFPGYNKLDLSTVAERPVVAVLHFAAASGPASAGVGHLLNGERYYILLADGRIAILTVLQPTVSYDKDLGRRVALTLKAIK